MSKVRLAFLGTPSIAVTCLEALLQDDHYEVVGVITQPDKPAGRKMQLTMSPVKELALKKQIPVLTPAKASHADVINEIKEWRAECAVVVAYGQILSQAFLDSFPFGAVNIHASLLPLWRGAAPIQRAVENGDVETGVALQKIVKELDAGDLLGVRKLKIEEQWNALDLLDVLAKRSVELLHIELMDYLRGNLFPVPQDHSKVTYAKKLLKTESHLNWSEDALKIHNKIRAFQMGPGTWSETKAGKFKIHRTSLLPDADKFTVALKAEKPGTILIADNRFFVATGRGVLEVLELQQESRQKLKTIEFLKGNAISNGDVFN